MYMIHSNAGLSYLLSTFSSWFDDFVRTEYRNPVQRYRFWTRVAPAFLGAKYPERFDFPDGVMARYAFIEVLFNGLYYLGKSSDRESDEHEVEHDEEEDEEIEDEETDESSATGGLRPSFIHANRNMKLGNFCAPVARWSSVYNYLNYQEKKFKKIEDTLTEEQSAAMFDMIESKKNVLTGHIVLPSFAMREMMTKMQTSASAGRSLVVPPTAKITDNLFIFKKKPFQATATTQSGHKTGQHRYASPPRARGGAAIPGQPPSVKPQHREAKKAVGRR